MKVNQNVLWFIVAILGTISFGAGRILLPSHGLHGADVFKDLAHVFVGVLFGAAIVATIRCPVQHGRPHVCPEIWLWCLALGLTAVEVFAAIFKQPQ